jgi:two-component system NtrC family sensor kinase
MKMKKVFISFFALLFFHCISAQQLFRLADDHHVVLDRGWKYTMDDNPVYASPSFDERGWKPIHPDLDVHDSLPADAASGIGWMRLRFAVGDSVKGKNLALSIHQSVASEIYLNGKLLKSFGVLNKDPEKVQPFDPVFSPIVFPLSDDSIQVLAVRFAIKPGLLYTTIFEAPNALVYMESSDHESAVQFYRRINILEHCFQMLMIGIFVMIFIVHFSFYVLVPEQKANLYFSLYGVSYIFGAILQLKYYLYSNDVAGKFYAGNMAFVFLMVCSLFLMLSIYTFLNRKIDIYFKAVLVFFFVAIVLNAWPYPNGWKMGGPIFQLLTYLNLIRITFLSITEKKRGARVLMMGTIATIVLFGLFIYQGTFTNSSFLQKLTVIRLANYLLYILSLPSAVSFFLAQDFALTSNRLKQKLVEVNDLSVRNLAIEKEKQEILASQNLQLETQVKERTRELSKSLEELTSAQAQLLHSEKMASLGELTAGIAHEIQNPLNFVNNFSEVNMELSDEIMEAIKKGDITGIQQLAEDIKSNQEKILEHGHRADSIVKSMLQHSRSSTGNKELTDINTLVDEYARLSYHGIKAKDKTFNVTFKADYDPNVGACYVIPQDIGRVLLNLFNNAFYVVTEKNAQHIPDYEPTVTVSTRLGDENGNEINPSIRQSANSPIHESANPRIRQSANSLNVQSVIIKVKDNGNGIPEKLREKIFQPFFTTKPTGSGTGLGLSLSYDIIKSHGGELSVISKEGEGAEFIFQIPYPGN